METDKFIKSVCIQYDMEQILTEWQELWIPGYTPRDVDYSWFFPKVRKVISVTGCRRVGKTYLLFQLIDFLAKKGIDKDRIIYINFEDERIEREVKTLSELIPTLIELYGDKEYYLFLDEIHVMPKWDIWLRRIHDKYRNVKIFISGSSSKLSTRELPYALRGRTLNYEIFPLGFSEFLAFKNFRLEKSSTYTERTAANLKRLANEYILYGGFPEIVLEEDLRKKREISQEYFRTIIALDIVERYKIRNIGGLSDFLKLLLKYTYFSVNKTYNTLRSLGKKVGKESLMNYTHYLEEIYFCYFIPIFSYKIKDQLQYPKKVYVVDNSFINFVGFSSGKNMGRSFENVVALELIRRFGKESIFYWKNPKGREVDFVIRQSLNVDRMFQVCYDINDPETKKREVNSIIEGSNELKCQELLIITGNYEGKEKHEDKSVKFVPLWKWLLGDHRK